METTDLINFDEVCEPKLSVPTYYMMEQELFETKRKLSLLEERMIRLEEKLGNLELEEKFDKIELEEKMNKLEKQNFQSLSVIPLFIQEISDVDVGVSGFKRFGDSKLCKINKINFCNINSSCIKMDLYYLYIDRFYQNSVFGISRYENSLNAIKSQDQRHFSFFLKMFTNSVNKSGKNRKCLQLLLTRQLP